jgi:hypothetical protein
MEEKALLGNFVRLADYLLVAGVTARALAVAEDTRTLLTAGRAAVRAGRAAPGPCRAAPPAACCRRLPD